MTYESVVKQGQNKVYRRLWIKRRNVPSGTYESDWQEYSSDVMKWGKPKVNIDPVLTSKIKFSTTNFTVSNLEGRWNPNDDQSSIWYGYADQQRTLVRFEAGYLDQTLGTDGIWRNVRYPQGAEWDEESWDSSVWDGSPSYIFGIISGDILYNERKVVTLPVKPVLQAFVEFPAKNLDFYTTTGLTASEFIEGVRDFTDNDGNYVFRPFFNDTTTGFEISTTTTQYTELNGQDAKDVRDKTVWQVIERLAQAENYVARVNLEGNFIFGPKDVDSVTSWEFNGAGVFNSQYGHSIIDIKSYGFKHSKYYSRVRLQWAEGDTSTSYLIKESAFTVSSSSTPWTLGYRTLEVENLWISTLTVASTVVNTIFNEASGYKKEIEFSSVFLPQIDLLDRISLSYDSTQLNQESLWDYNDWNTELTWDPQVGNPLTFSDKEFKIISIQQDLDKFMTVITAREI